jgi:hypothetical protein
LDKQIWLRFEPAAAKSSEIQQHHEDIIIDIITAANIHSDFTPTCSSVMQRGAAVLILSVNITPCFNNAFDAAGAAIGSSFMQRGVLHDCELGEGRSKNTKL